MSRTLYKCKECENGVVEYNPDSDSMQCDCCLAYWSDEPENTKRKGFNMKDSLMIFGLLIFIVVMVKCSAESVEDMGKRIREGRNGTATDLRNRV